MPTQPTSDCRSVLLAADAEPARLIVCERTGRWAVTLRRELDGADVRVHESRSLVECWQQLAEAPAGFVVVELTGGNVASLLERLARLPREFPLARVAVVADRSLAKYEWLIREAGAVHFTCSSRQLGPLGRAVRAHLDQAPAPPQTLVEQVWASLPW
ncbi:MAG: hypothetical protein HQ567_25935 [Candidatus Nealsonbacteria bacterium]|nr:hypothetical protein [Candidatus Nealsonbacteria bacterium]